MDTVVFKMNGMDMTVPAGSTILEAARGAKVRIPTLCFLEGINEAAACRICVVEVKGAKALVPACVTPVDPDMEVWTDSPEVIESRRMTLDLICSDHRMDCEYCSRYSNCELHALCREYGIDDREYGFSAKEPEEDDSSVHMVWDRSKCVHCRRCAAACQRKQMVGVIGPFNRGSKTRIGSALPLIETSCVHCGQCIVACPTGALVERDDTAQAWKAINDPSKLVVALLSPAVSARLGECFFEADGFSPEGKSVAILRRLGFDKVHDMRSAAEIAALEIGKELLERLKRGERLPLIGSACPSWVKYCETYHPEYIDNLSTCKSPSALFGALYKNLWAEKTGVKPGDVFVVSIVPCTAGKFERQRPELSSLGHPDIDVSLTSRELESMIKRSCVSRFTAQKVWEELPEEAFDPIPSEWLDAVLGREAAAAKPCGNQAPYIPFQSLSELGLAGPYASGRIQEAVYELAGSKFDTAIASGLDNAERLLTELKTGHKAYAYIEIEACPGGCIFGGGQPRYPNRMPADALLLAERAGATRRGETSATPASGEARLLDGYVPTVQVSPRARGLFHTSFFRRAAY